MRTIKNPISKYLTHYQDCLKRNEIILEIVGKKNPLSICVDKDKKNIEKYLRRDTVWFSINIGIVTISILLFLPFIPITLSAPVLIATLSLALASGVGNIALRIYDRNFGSTKEEPIELDTFETNKVEKTSLLKGGMKPSPPLEEINDTNSKKTEIKAKKQ